MARVFRRARVTTVVVFGKKAGPCVEQVLDASPMGSSIAHWGDETIDKYLFGRNGKMLVLPHLSRFSLFHRASSEAAFRAALAGEAESLTSAAPLPGPMPRSGRYGPNDVIHLIVPGNPKISNRKSILRFDCYRDGMALAEYEAAVLAALGADEAAKCRKDLRWDTEHNFIQIERR